MAQAEDSEIIRRMPDVDMVIGPQTYHKLPELVSKLDKKRRRLSKQTFQLKISLICLQEEKGSKRSLLPF